jgi:L-2-hydroxyglutarate oxidase LhgO
MDQTDTIVIGAGVVGLAVARELALSGREVIVLEAAEAIGTETSSRNSEVIHAGIYYPTGSLKARLCVAGKHLLYDYCACHGVAHRRIGKVLVATHEDEVPTLAKYQKLAASNGVHDLQWLDAAQVRELEPAVSAVAGVLSPSTGIVDSHAFMLSLQGELEARGGMIAFHAPVTGGEITQAGIVVEAGGAAPMNLLCNTLVNSAGLSAQNVARALRGFPLAQVPLQYFAKAHYYTMAGRSPFRRLIYPMPVAGGLGTHVTLDLGGQVKFGPDVRWVDRVDYDFDDSRAADFYASVRRYYPALRDGDLQPGYTGMRPKVSGPDEPAGDFIIQGAREHGVRGLVNLFGIESPGLTASLAIARSVREMLEAQ